jgi:hypothetical protein
MIFAPAANETVLEGHDRTPRSIVPRISRSFEPKTIRDGDPISLAEDLFNVKTPRRPLPEKSREVRANGLTTQQFHPTRFAVDGFGRKTCCRSQSIVGLPRFKERFEQVARGQRSASYLGAVQPVMVTVTPRSADQCWWYVLLQAVTIKS